MRLRVRFGQLRFAVDIEDESATLLKLKEAVSKTTSIRLLFTILFYNDKVMIGVKSH